MNRYIYCEATQDYWPSIKKISANSYQDAVEKLIERYATELDNDTLLQYSDFNAFRERLNDEYVIAISDLEDIEEL